MCSVPDCDRETVGLGFCSVHYARFKRNGDPLSGRTRVGEPAAFLEDVVLKYDGDDCLTWPFGRDSHGRGNVTYEGAQHVVSRLVCKIAHGEAPSPAHDAAHSCGNGHLACVTKRHLSWKTRKENHADKLVHGTHNRGSRHNLAKLTEEQVREIFASKGALSQRVLAERFGVSRPAIAAIHVGLHWGWLTSNLERKQR